MISQLNIYRLIIIDIIIAFYLYTGVSYGQVSVTGADSLNARNFSEEIYLQTDRDIYFTGEQIWLKVIKMERMTGFPIDVSQVVYLEMLGGSDNVISQVKINASGSFANGIIRIPDTLSTGNYLIRAYTSWMKNYPVERYFHRYISVINPFDGFEKIVKRTPLTGTDSVISSPEAKAYNNGVTFEIMKGEPDSPVTIRIIKNGSRIRPGEMGRIIIRTAGLISMIREFRFGVDTILKISREIIPSGISEIIMTDEPGEILAGRWFFNNSRTFNITVNTDSSEYHTRQRVRVDISASGKKDLPLATPVSVSVIKKSLVYGSRIDIVSTDGLIKSGNEWFAGREPEEINDHLPAFEQSVSDTLGGILDQPLFLPELEGELLRGVIKNRSTGEPVANTDISVSFVGKNALCQFARSDAKGRFSFAVDINGLREIVIQPMDPEISNYFVELDQPFSNTFIKLEPPRFELDSTMAEKLNDAVVAMQVSSIYEPFRQKVPESQEEIVISDFYGEPDKRILLADYIELTTMREVVKEIIPGLSVVRKNKQMVFRLINNYPFVPFENMALVLVDGVPVYDIGKLLEVSSKEIERIDIFNRRYFYSNYVFDGILSFISKRGDHSSLETENGIFRQVYQGYQRRQSFYSPVYNSEELRNSRIPDFRNTLFWEPMITTDSNGKTSTVFYTSDEKGEYTIIVEGLTRDGRKGVASGSFVVR